MDANICEYFVQLEIREEIIDVHYSIYVWARNHCLTGEFYSKFEVCITYGLKEMNEMSLEVKIRTWRGSSVL